MDAINWIPHGPNDGLKAIMLANRGALLRFVAARRVLPDEAEDLLQDLFVKIECQAIGPVAEPRAYLYRMLDNLLLDRRRAAARRAGREDAWSTAWAGGTCGADDQPSVERVLIARERVAMVWSALSELPERTVEVFRRFRLDGVPQKRIADDLGISVSAVEKHLQKAYKVVVELQEKMNAEMMSPRRP